MRAGHAMQETALSFVVEGLSVGYGGRIVVANVCLALQPGKTIALLGINGAGKSTCLKGIAGVLRPQQGSVRLDGEELVGRTVSQNARTGLVLVPEGARSFQDMSVLDNLEMGGFVIPDRSLLCQRLNEVLKWFPRLRERAMQRAGSLSGGERQMLAIARVLMLRPRVLLLDEPFLGLAPIMITEVSNQIARIRTETGCGIIIAEQHVSSVLRVCDEAFMLRDGSIFSVDRESLMKSSEQEQVAVLFGVS